MLKRFNKTDKSPDAGPTRVLVVDDHPAAAKLLGKLLRRSGYEVAEVADEAVALHTLQNETTPITAVVASFSSAGIGAGIKLLDAIRRAPEPQVKGCRVVLMTDRSSQVLFAWQSGADAIIERPYSADHLLDELAAAIARDDAERAAWRAERVEELRRIVTAAAEQVGAAPRETIVEFH